MTKKLLTNLTDKERMNDLLKKMEEVLARFRVNESMARDLKQSAAVYCVRERHKDDGDKTKRDALENYIRYEAQETTTEALKEILAQKLTDWRLEGR